ncbi:putative CTLH/CRA to LisH motif domain-containing protein [Dioscorea sansibarensis]
MDSMPVNWDALDSLVLDFAQSERLLDESPSSDSHQSRLLIRQIRRCVEDGDIDRAIDLLRLHVPAVLDDHRVLFRLQKQRFIELLRRGTVKDRELAMKCLRVALAPCALDAYPEAYEEFKHVLLALIYDKDDKTSPVANEWSERRRFDLAGSLSSILRAQLHAYDPLLAMTLRYLMSIHKVFCTHQDIPSPISDITERFLFEDRDPPITSHESLYEVPPFEEVDVQALVHAAELTRQDAVDSLRFAKGDLFQAFQNELCRMKLNALMLDELVREYCVYRGIVESATTSSSDCTSQSKLCMTNGSSNGEVSDSTVNKEGVQESHVDIVSTQNNDVEMRSADEITGAHGDCSTSDVSHQVRHYRRLRRSRNNATGQRRRKRWRGRIERFEAAPDVDSTKSILQEFTSSVHSDRDTPGEEQVSESNSTFDNVNDIEDHKYEIILEMMELANKGMVAEVVEEVNALDPEFFVQNPILLFQLKQVEFLKLVNAGNHAMALRVASSHLGPLASKNEALLKSLKETLLALLKPNEDVMTKGLSLLATSLQVAMSRRFGIEEPQLMKIMRATLHTHNEWFKLQMCKDRFEEFLKINILKELDAPLPSDSTSKTQADNETHGSSSQVTSSSSKITDYGSSPAQVASNENVFDENAILKVMEFLALPRSDAIHLLMQYNGNAEAVIQQIFA